MRNIPYSTFDVALWFLSVVEGALRKRCERVELAGYGRNVLTRYKENAKVLLIPHPVPAAAAAAAVPLCRILSRPRACHFSSRPAHPPPNFLLAALTRRLGFYSAIRRKKRRTRDKEGVEREESADKSAIDVI